MIFNNIHDQNNDDELLSEKLTLCWHYLYGDDKEDVLNNFVERVKSYKTTLQFNDYHGECWYKNAVVYALYVDKFNKDFFGLADKFDYLKHLGVNCLWLLPILQSPMRDGGFDISDYRRVRPSLFGLSDDEGAKSNQLFKDFVRQAHDNGFKVIFDIAMNHCSDKNAWFESAVADKESPYRDYFIWNDTPDKYSGARVIFKGMSTGNWTRVGDQYYFHRFFGFQPDLNYRNSVVLLEIADILLYWLSYGVDGFRADAIPFLWKEEGTDCENLPQTHVILKFLRSVIDYVSPGTLLLAEAVQKPADIAKYLTVKKHRDDVVELDNIAECNGAYNFPLMTMIFKAIACNCDEPIKEVLKSTPEISSNSQWFTLLRCHDEFSLEGVFVSEEDRRLLREHFCTNPLWKFREGEGIASRLSEMMQMDADKIIKCFEILFSLNGTPVIYYGDEFGMRNDERYYHHCKSVTGNDDSRYLIRGPIDWDEVELKLADETGAARKIFNAVARLIAGSEV